MPDLFDLWTAPFLAWASRRTGHMRVGLRGLLEHAGDLHPTGTRRPQTAVAVLRLLLVLMHKTRPAVSDAEWSSLWKSDRMPDDWIAEIERVSKGRLNLFPELTREEIQDIYEAGSVPTATAIFQSWSPVDKLKTPAYLLPEFATGQGVIHLRPELEDDVVLCASCAAMGILELPAYSSAHGGGYFSAPAGNFPIYAMPVGEDLWHTLLLNWPLPRHGDPEDDAPSWERSWGMEPLGMLAAMTWVPKHVMLMPPEGGTKRCSACGTTTSLFVDRIIYDILRQSLGDEARKISEQTHAWRDPHAIYVPRKKGEGALGLLDDPSKHSQAWRDAWSGLLKGRCASVEYAQSRVQSDVKVTCVTVAANKNKVRFVRRVDVIAPHEDRCRELFLAEFTWLEDYIRELQEVNVEKSETRGAALPFLDIPCAAHERPRLTVNSAAAEEKVRTAFCQHLVGVRDRELCDEDVATWRSFVRSALGQHAHLETPQTVAGLRFVSAVKDHLHMPHEDVRRTRNREHRDFFTRLAALDAAALAALRSASEQDHPREYEAHEAFLRAHRPARPRASRWACHLVALLFAWDPRASGGLPLGGALTRLPVAHAEWLLESLLRASEITLRADLLTVVRALADAKVPLDWSLMLDDIAEWKTQPQTVALRWAAEYLE